ncbi:MAG: D-Ala-D-Ala carboxypeptidase family metallohydrolase [Cellvibrionaceae bacterium]
MDLEAFGGNFSRSEFACKCGCGFDTADTELVYLLNKIRFHFNAPIRINSGARCKTHNKKEGGKHTSQHLIGRAADIVVSGASPIEVADYAETLIPNHGGIGRYISFTHIDTRANKARW